MRVWLIVKIIFNGYLIRTNETKKLNSCIKKNVNSSFEMYTSNYFTNSRYTPLIKLIKLNK